MTSRHEKVRLACLARRNCLGQAADPIKIALAQASNLRLLHDLVAGAADLRCSVSSQLLACTIVLRLVQILHNHAGALFGQHERAGPADKTASRRKWLRRSILLPFLWHRQMVCNIRTAKVVTMLDIVPTDFCSLPMIIDNGSHATAEHAATSSPGPQNKATSAATEAPRTQAPFESSEGHDNEDDATVTDVILEHVENAVVNFSSSLANAFTSKLRHACITVLKHTESSVLQETADTFPYDDDARFLD